MSLCQFYCFEAVQTKLFNGVFYKIRHLTWSTHHTHQFLIHTDRAKSESQCTGKGPEKQRDATNLIFCCFETIPVTGALLRKHFPSILQVSLEGR